MCVCMFIYIYMYYIYIYIYIYIEFISSEKYVEEHIILYNRQELSERQIIGLRFASDCEFIGTFHRTLDKNSYASLEESLVLFIVNFKQFWIRTTNISSRYFL